MLGAKAKQNLLAVTAANNDVSINRSCLVHAVTFLINCDADINEGETSLIMKFLEMNDNLYYIYEGTLRLSKDGIHSNDKKTFIDKLIKWHN